MKPSTLDNYPKRIIRLLAAVEAIAKQVGQAPSKVGFGYAGLAAILTGEDKDSLRQMVLAARKDGLLRVVQAGGGRGAKAMFALTEKGAQAL